MATIAVTGGSGRAGQYVIAELLAHGYSVRSIDRQAPQERVTPFHLVDLTDLGQVYGALAGTEAVLHLAAIPGPTGRPPEAVFGNNVTATFNVVQAAATLGLRRLVFISTDSTLGFPWATRRDWPDYVPVNEAHPQRPQDPYGLSKVVGEQICQAAHRRTGLSTVVLRSTHILAPDMYADWIGRQREDPQRGAFNLWSYVDARDLAVACRLALEVEPLGYEVCYVAAPETTSDVPSRELYARYYPEVASFAPTWGGNQSSLDCRRAREVLGWQPQHSWRQELQQ
jgi:nucleoside-diphosphate-sugar epimerase